MQEQSPMFDGGALKVVQLLVEGSKNSRGKRNNFWSVWKLLYVITDNMIIQ
jgi:hypothetical protein